MTNLLTIKHKSTTEYRYKINATPDWLCLACETYTLLYIDWRSCKKWRHLKLISP